MWETGIVRYRNGMCVMQRLRNYVFHEKRIFLWNFNNLWHQFQSDFLHHLSYFRMSFYKAEVFNVIFNHIATQSIS